MFTQCFANLAGILLFFFTYHQALSDTSHFNDLTKYRFAGNGEKNTNGKDDLYMTTYVERKNIEAGLYKDNSEKTIFISGNYTSKRMNLHAGFLKRSINEGWLVSNGAYLPEHSSLAKSRPIGSSLEVLSPQWIFASYWYLQREHNQPISNRTQALVNKAGWQNYHNSYSYYLGMGLFTFNNANNVMTMENSRPFTHFSFRYLKNTFSINLSLIIRNIENSMISANTMWNKINIRLLIFRNREPSVLAAQIFNDSEDGIYLKSKNKYFINSFYFIENQFKNTTRITWGQFGGYAYYRQNSAKIFGVFHKPAPKKLGLNISAYKWADAKSYMFSAGIGFGNTLSVAFIQSVNNSTFFYPIDPVFLPSNFNAGYYEENNHLFLIESVRGIQAFANVSYLQFYFAVLKNNKSKTIPGENLIINFHLTAGFRF